MAPCLDTDIVIEFFRGRKSVVEKIEEKIQNNEQLSLTPITLCELFRGAYLSDYPERELHRIEKFAESCAILEFTTEACRKFGMVSAGLTKEGAVINDADLLIGCLAFVHDHTLITNNTKHFSRIKGLRVDNWIQRNDDK